jgi:hypothetical protein
MTLEDRISQFIGKALTRLRVLQAELIEDFDYRGYLNDNAEELLLQISETYDYIDLLQSDYKGGLTEKEIRDLIDFFFWWLELAPVIAANYAYYKMPVEGIIGGGGGGGGAPGGVYATVAQLNAEIQARIAADAALDARIDALELFDPSTIFPEGFFDNYLGSYSVVFDDDPRLHLHANLVELDQIAATDIVNIKALTAHFESVGSPGGLHVSQADRDRWDAASVEVDPIPPEVYNLTSPSTVTVGGLPAGTNLVGRTWQSIIEEILVEYILPSFNSFAISDIPAVVEVGIPITGVHNFTWSTTTSFNVLANSIAIRDVTANTLIGSGLANDGNEALNIGTIANTAPMSRSWRAEGKNSLNVTFVSGQDSVMSLYPYFYGKVLSGGVAPGLGRPVANQALIASGTKVVANSNGTISVNFNSGSDHYLWFAIPASSASKLAWFVSTLNNGAIGGAVNPGGNLFPAFDTVAIDSPTVLWAGVNYKIYVSNYQSAITALMELRNA